MAHRSLLGCLLQFPTEKTGVNEGDFTKTIPLVSPHSLSSFHASEVSQLGNPFWLHLQPFQGLLHPCLSMRCSRNLSWEGWSQQRGFFPPHLTPEGFSQPVPGRFRTDFPSVPHWCLNSEVVSGLLASSASAWDPELLVSTFTPPSAFCCWHEGNEDMNCLSPLLALLSPHLHLPPRQPERVWSHFFLTSYPGWHCYSPLGL